QNNKGVSNCGLNFLFNYLPAQSEIQFVPFFPTAAPRFYETTEAAPSTGDTVLPQRSSASGLRPNVRGPPHLLSPRTSQPPHSRLNSCLPRRTNSVSAPHPAGSSARSPKPDRLVFPGPWRDGLQRYCGRSRPPDCL